MSMEELENISLILKKDQNIDVINKSTFIKDSFILVQDQEGKQFMLMIFHKNSGNVIFNMMNLTIQIAKQQKLMKMLNLGYPNVSKVSQIQIGYDHFNKIPKLNTLLDFIQAGKNKELSQCQFLSISLQLLCSFKYVESQQCVVKDISLNNIFLDDELNILIYDCLYDPQNQYKISTQKYQERNREMYYLPPEIRKQMLSNENQHTIYTKNQRDAWEFGICMYILAGGTFSDAEELSQGIGLYEEQDQLSEEINQALRIILQSNINSRPKIDDIIKQFSTFYRENVEANRPTQSNVEKELFNQAQQELDTFNYEEAISTINKLIEINSTNDEYYAMLGFAQLEVQKYEESKKSCQKSLEINKLNDFAISNMAYLFMKEDNKELSYSYAIFSMHLNQNNHWALLIQGFNLSNQKQYQKSVQILEKAFSIKSRCPYVCVGLADDYYKLGKIKDSLDFLKKSEKIHPKNVYCLWQLVKAHEACNQISRAIKYVNKILDLEKTSENQVNKRTANIYAGKQKYEKTISKLKINEGNKDVLVLAKRLI